MKRMTEDGKVEIADIDRLRDAMVELLEEEVITPEIMGSIYDLLLKKSEQKKVELMEDYLIDHMRPGD